jgi:hypothetical protein
MPTPLEILLDPISLAVIAIFLGLVAWEALAPGRPLPAVRGWKLRGLAAFAAFFYLSSYLPLLWDEHLAAYQLFDLSGFGIAGGVVAGMLASQFLGYWWHRALHRSDTLWLGLHQMHHSAERLDTWSAYWFSPLDMVGWTAIGSLALVLVVGIDPAGGDRRAALDVLPGHLPARERAHAALARLHHRATRDAHVAPRARRAPLQLRQHHAVRPVVRHFPQPARL